MRRQKNRNILRRLKNKKFAPSCLRVFLLSAFCFLLSACFVCCDKQEMLYNSWQLQSVKMNGKPYSDSLQYNLTPNYTYYTFFYDNALIVRTYAMQQITTSSDGFYKLESNSKLEMSFTILNKRYSINAKIKKLTKKELNLEYEDKGNTYFLKLYTNRDLKFKNSKI